MDGSDFCTDIFYPWKIISFLEKIIINMPKKPAQIFYDTLFSFNDQCSLEIGLRDLEIFKMFNADKPNLPITYINKYL